MLIYCPKNSARLDFISTYLFQERLGISFRFTSNIEEFKAFGLEKLNYSELDLESTLQIIPHGLLFENTIRNLEIDIGRWGQLPVFFETQPKELIPFDFLSATFFLISRYEEYCHPANDEHGRFSAEHSVAFKHHFLRKPLVDYWITEIKKILKTTYPQLEFRKDCFTQINTIDIDQTFCYRGKGIYRNVAGLFRDLIRFDLRKIAIRVTTLIGLNPDPYDVFDYLQRMLSDQNQKSIFFYLMGDYGRYDKNLPFENMAQNQVIRQLSTWAEIGIHPSYGFSHKLINEKNLLKAQDQLNKEISRLQDITKHTIAKSRLHFLKFRLPDTYSLLARSGIQHDYSMCYSGYPGFRASTAFPYKFFDLQNNKAENIWIHPSAVMDVSLRIFQGLNVEESIAEIQKLKNEVKNVGGEFSIIWHNESLSETGIWQGWRKVFENSLQD